MCSPASHTTGEIHTNDTKLLLFGIICDKWVQENFHQLRLLGHAKTHQPSEAEKNPFTGALLRARERELKRPGNRTNQKAKQKKKWSEILNLFSNNEWLQIWLHMHSIIWRNMFYKINNAAINKRHNFMRPIAMYAAKSMKVQLLHALLFIIHNTELK